MPRTNGDGPVVPWPTSNQSFLEAIYGPEWPRVHVAGFAGDPQNMPRESGAWKGEPAGGWCGRAERPGDNNYFTVSLFHPDRTDGAPRRRGELLDTWRVLGLDDVGVGQKVAPADVLRLLGEPTYRIETSPGNEQWGYVLAEPVADAAWANAALKAVRLVLGHNDARDLTRLMRLPVGRNQKKAYDPVGFQVRMTAWNNQVRLHFTDALCARLGLSPVSPGSTGAVTKIPISVTARSTARSSTGDAAIDALAECDILFQAMRRLDLVMGGPRPSAMGRAYDLICPWVDEHTDRATTGTAYVPILQRFECHHGHCRERTVEHVESRLEEQLRDASGGLSGLIDVAFDVVDPTTVVLPAVAPRTATRDEQAFFARFVYVRPKDMLWDVERRVLVRDRDVNVAWGQRLADVLPRASTGGRQKAMAPVTWFLTDRRGRRVEGMISWPWEGPVVRHGSQRLWNLWHPVARPFQGHVVDEARVRPWLDLFWHVIGQETLDAWVLGETVLDWLAMVLASGVKGGWQVVVIGQQGIGKDMILTPVMRTLGGEQAQVLRGDTMASAFSEWMALRLVQLSETRQTTRGSFTPHDQMARLKWAFDQGKDWMPINPKYAPGYQARNVLMGWLTSNEDVPLRLEPGDRRFLVLDRKDVTRLPAPVYSRLARWLEHEDGIELVAEWLFQRWEQMADARRWVLTGTAPMTDAKAVMIEENEDLVDVWLRGTMESTHPDPNALPDVVTVDFVKDRMLAAQRNGEFGMMRPNVHPVSIGKRLARVGATQLNRGAQVVVQGRRTRVWAVRNQMLYENLGADDLIKVANLLGRAPSSHIAN